MQWFFGVLAEYDQYQALQVLLSNTCIVWEAQDRIKVEMLKSKCVGWFIPLGQLSVLVSLLAAQLLSLPPLAGAPWTV